MLNIETRLMGQMAPDYDNLCLIQKVEVFKYALSNTTGTDLYKVLWLKISDPTTQNLSIILQLQQTLDATWPAPLSGWGF